MSKIESPPFPAPPPRDEHELMARTQAIAGLSLGELAQRYQQIIPGENRRAKGWAGQFLEGVLGATASSLPEPDFQAIGVELKTLPISLEGQPLESTYVCPVALSGEDGVCWEGSYLRRKMARVLWLPIAGPRGAPVTERRIATPLLWSPNESEEATLKQDWEELMELVTLGQIDQITAHHGVHLQIRPKGANARSLRRGTGTEGQPTWLLPRGFYLRTSFTRQILERAYILP